MSASDETILNYLRSLDEDGDNETPKDPKHQSHWDREKLIRSFSRLPSGWTCEIAQIGTSDAYFWGNIWIRNSFEQTIINITLSHFGNLVYIYTAANTRIDHEVSEVIENALSENRSVVVPEHIVLMNKTEKSEDTWFRRFFDYV